MSFHFCPQCGTKLQPSFRFCPSCGQKLPFPSDTSGPEDAPTLSVSPLRIDGIGTAVDKTSPSASSATGPDCSPTPISTRPPLQKTRNSLRLVKGENSPTKRTASPFICSPKPAAGPDCSPTPISTRPPLQKTRNSLRLVKGENSPTKRTASPFICSPKPAAGENVTSKVSPFKLRPVTSKLENEVEPVAETSSLPVLRSPLPVKGKAKKTKRAHTGKQLDEGKILTDGIGTKEKEPAVDAFALSVSSPVSSPFSSPIARSPSKVKGNVKKAKRVCAVTPLEEGEELTDTTGRKWRLVRLLSQSTTELIYEVSASNSKETEHILKLGAKDGRIFNEQNFLQRAAKPSSVNKWMKGMKMDFLGIPSCVGFGLHADTYRFLIFPSMGQNLQSIMEEGEELLSEKAVLQLACRILDVLEFIHSNEYVHADIHAENIYIKPDEQTQVYLAGYCHAFRYCPGGHHVEYREASRTLHEGAIEFISLDSHNGAGPSRRSDLQSLGYCMLHWYTGKLPWTALTCNPNKVASEKQRYMEDVPALVRHCFGQKKVSSALDTYLTEVMALQYTDQPDYKALKAGLSDSLSQMGGSLRQPLSL